jgi:iron complex transport system substrate-binding protein
MASVVVFSYFNCGNNKELPQTSALRPRIISFAPSLTETVFEIRAERHLVGVTDFCGYPPEAKKLPKVGGYVDPNYEQILKLRPDGAIVLREHGALIDFLGKHHIQTVKVDNKNIKGIVSSFSSIGALCGLKKRGDSLGKALEMSLASVRPTAGTEKPKLLICVGRDNPGSGVIGRVYCAGTKTFYHELLVRAGGVNVIDDSLMLYPALGAEGVIRLAPDIIIDLMASVAQVQPEKVKEDWKSLPMIPAVKAGTVYALTGEYVSIPGPRILLIYNDLHRCISGWHSRCRRGNACLRFK